MKLGFPLQEVTENGGPVVLAYMATCNCSGSEIFSVFQVAGQNHFHIECVDCETAYCPFGICQMSDSRPRPDPVHQEEGQWYFWDEAQIDRYGPFPDEGTARREHEMYLWQRNQQGGP